jgi:hypothetical protein
MYDSSKEDKSYKFIKNIYKMYNDNYYRYIDNIYMKSQNYYNLLFIRYYYHNHINNLKDEEFKQKYTISTTNVKFDVSKVFDGNAKEDINLKYFFFKQEEEEKLKDIFPIENISSSDDVCCNLPFINLNIYYSSISINGGANPKKNKIISYLYKCQKKNVK